jgi:hypothetical protein
LAVPFFDLITFFGVASFFAWLGFAPLQSDQLSRFKGINRTIAGRKFSLLNDYFLLSFLSFAISALSDYLFHIPTFHSGEVLLLVGMGFFAGLVWLLTPMWYVRSVVSGVKTWATVNPPDYIYTMLICSWTSLELDLSFPRIIVGVASWENLIWFSAGAGTIAGLVLLMKHWNAPRGKGAFGFLLTLPPILLTGFHGYVCLMTGILCH